MRWWARCLARLPGATAVSWLKPIWMEKHAADAANKNGGNRAQITCPPPHPRPPASLMSKSRCRHERGIDYLLHLKDDNWKPATAGFKTASTAKTLPRPLRSSPRRRSLTTILTTARGSVSAGRNSPRRQLGRTSRDAGNLHRIVAGQRAEALSLMPPMPSRAQVPPTP